MAENAYLLRLKQLRDQKVEAEERRAAPVLGRPMTRQAPGPAMVPNQPTAEEEEQPDMESMFGKNLQSFEGEDKRFGQFMQEYAQLAEGLKQEVDNGFMPMPIAQQRLQSYLQDSAGYFQKNAAGPMDNPEISAMMEGMLGQAMQGQLPEQQAQGGAPQGEQPPMPPQGGM